MTERPPESLLAVNDPSLAAFLLAGDEASRRMAMDDVVAQVQPLVITIIERFRRTDPLPAHDAEDLAASILLRVVHRLQLVAISEEHAIETLDAYVATLTYNALYDVRRRRNPERTRLKNRLRYLVTSDRRFSAVPIDHDLICGLAGWTGPREIVQTTSVSAATASPAMRNQERPAEGLAAILEGIGNRITLTALVRVVAEIWNVHDHASSQQPTEVAPSPLTMLESKEYLETLWTEIRALPERQRAALLLNLRDGHGANALGLFLLLGVTTVDELAESVGMSVAELNELWSSLPLDDLSIAERLGLSRQQVINLRKAGRARLNRRITR